MPESIFGATYSARDAAYACNIHDFRNFKGNLTKEARDGVPVLLIPPKEARSGRAGSDYRYANIVELALHRYLAGFTREETRAIVWSAFLHLQREMAEAINPLPDKDREIILASGSSVDPEDPYAVRLAKLIDYPAIGFREAVLSRNPEKPTLWLVRVRGVRLANNRQSTPEAEITWIRDGSISAVDAWRQFEAKGLEGIRRDDHEARALVSERLLAPVMVNVTEIMRRVDDRLALRLRARELGAGD